MFMSTSAFDTFRVNFAGKVIFLHLIESMVHKLL